MRTAPGSGSATPPRVPNGNAEDDKAWEVDGFLKLPTAEEVLRWHAEAVGRVVELSQPGQVYVLWAVSITRRTDPYGPSVLPTR